MNSLKQGIGVNLKIPVSHMCFAGVVVAFWSLTQEVAGSNPFKIVTNIYRSQCRGACVVGGLA